MADFTEGLCEKVQQSLNSVAADAPSLKRTQIGFTQALTSEQNTSGVEKVQVDQGNGKKRTVRLKYIQRAGDEAEIKEADITDCSTEVERSPLDQDVDLTAFLRSPGLLFRESEMKKLCESGASFMQTVINGELDLFFKVLNKKLLALQAANFGKFNGGDTYKIVTLLKGTERSANYDGEAQIMGAFEDLDVNSSPIVVGSGNLRDYARLRKIGCCNSYGQNLGADADLSYYNDRFVEGIMGANAFIGLVPGMVQLLTWNKYKGEDAKESKTFSHGTIIDPVTGIEVDMKWHYDDCADKYSLFFGVTYGLHHIPDDSFKAADELYGYNGSLKFVGVHGEDYGCCA